MGHIIIEVVISDEIIPTILMYCKRLTFQFFLTMYPAALLVWVTTVPGEY
jgi:hypothetical protein